MQKCLLQNSLLEIARKADLGTAGLYEQSPYGDHRCLCVRSVTYLHMLNAGVARLYGPLKCVHFRKRVYRRDGRYLSSCHISILRVLLVPRG